MTLNLRSGIGGYLLVIALYSAYAVLVHGVSFRVAAPMQFEEQTVLPAPLQIFLYGGDRYLAANVELTRVLMTGAEITGSQQDIYHRLHRVVAELNPCHEDNYYIANALLAWAGGATLATDILRTATDCRFWDFVPPFFLGFDLYYFDRDFVEAKKMLFLAAERSPENSVGFRKFGIMMEAESHPDLSVATAYLRGEWEKTTDRKLKELLGKRVKRLEGLMALRNAQAEYERRFHKKLENPDEIFSQGLLSGVPSDPLGLGYAFVGGEFRLRELSVKGLRDTERWKR